MFDWYPLVILLLLIVGLFVWKKQYHFAGLFGLIGVSLGGMELWSKLQTGHTISQNFSTWVIHDESWAWAFVMLWLAFSVYLVVHLMEKKR